MSCDGTMIGSPFAGERTLFDASISVRASICASSDKRHVHGHLVTVEVGVEGGADQRVQLDRLAFDQRRLERLNAETVQRRRAVEHDRMLADHLFEDIPHHRLLRFHHLLGLLDGRRQTHHLERLKMKGLNSSSAISLGRPH
jgi:hypothetical protein